MATGTVEERLGRTHPAKPQVKTHVSVKATGRFPRWLRALDTIHRADGPRVVAADALAVGGAAALAGVPTKALVPLTAALVTVLYVSNWYRFRTTLETQGVLWAFSLIGMPTALTVL